MGKTSGKIKNLDTKQQSSGLNNDDNKNNETDKKTGNNIGINGNINPNIHSIKEHEINDDVAVLIKKYKEKVKDLTSTLQRLQADFENYKKRVEKEKSDFKQYATAELIKKLLPVLDNFELAFKNKDDKEFKKGIELIYAQFLSVLEEQGLKPIMSEGEIFNPYLHEAMMQETSAKPAGTIIEEFQKGYMIGNKVIRHSKVKVSKGSE